MTPTLDCLVRAVLAAPYDEAPRAALADCLQENPALIAEVLARLVAVPPQEDFLTPPDWWDGWLDDDGLWAEPDVDCPTCDGVGVDTNGVCRECGGHGWRPG